MTPHPGGRRPVSNGFHNIIMTEDTDTRPNYRAINPPREKGREDYSYVERRAELYDLMEQAGHFRNLEKSTRDLGDRYDVSHTQIRKDIARIREWKADKLGDHAAADLELIKTRAVQDLLDRGDADKAYYLMMNHYETLMETGAAPRAAEEVEVDGDLTFVERLSRAAPDDIEVEDDPDAPGGGGA